MIQTADIREWLNQAVVDPGGHKIGELESVYVDTSTDEPAMATVRVGLPTRHRLVFVPLEGATVGPGYVRVAHDRKLVKQSPPSARTTSCPSRRRKPSSATTASPTNPVRTANDNSPNAEHPTAGEAAP